MTSSRKTALVAGVLYLVTFLTSIPAAFLLEPLLTDANYVASAGADTQVSLAAVLDVITALAGIGTAVAVFSIVKREHEGLALGFVTTRMLEGAVLAFGAVTILSVVTLRQAGAAGDEAESLVPVGNALVAMRDWTAVIGPGMASLNALMFGTLLYRARLVPRAIPLLGIVGAPLFIAFVVGTMLGATGPGTAFHAIAVAPFFFWELAVGLWMTFKGFNESAAILRGVPTASDAASRIAAGPHTVSANGGLA
jgi:hypothetical protein